MICRFAEQIGAFVDFFRRTPRFFIIFATGNDNNHRYMKKIVLMMMALVGALSMQAEEYAYLTFAIQIIQSSFMTACRQSFIILIYSRI